MASNETIDKLKRAGYITVTDDSQGIADKYEIPSTPTGSIDITENGEHDVAGYAVANVSVSGGQAGDDYVKKNSMISSWPDDNYDGMFLDVPQAHRYDIGYIWVEQLSHFDLPAEEIAFVKETLGNDFNINDDFETFSNKMKSALGPEGYYEWFEGLYDYRDFAKSGLYIYPKDRNEKFILTKSQVEEIWGHNLQDFIDDYEQLIEGEWSITDFYELLTSYDCCGSFKVTSLPLIPDIANPQVILLKNVTSELNASFPEFKGNNTVSVAQQPFPMIVPRIEFTFGEEGTISGAEYPNAYCYDTYFWQQAWVGSSPSTSFIDITMPDEQSEYGWKVIDIMDASWRTDSRLYCPNDSNNATSASNTDPWAPSTDHAYLITIIFPEIISSTTPDAWKTYADEFGYYIALVDFNMQNQL